MMPLRDVKACDSCHQSKQRCDQLHPSCTPYQQTGAQCSFETQPPPESPAIGKGRHLSQAKYYALLIGIDAYQKQTSFGAVNDVQNMREALNQQRSPPVEIRTLTATAGLKGELIERKEDLPTTSNVISALSELMRKVKKGDYVYIHYSGHGNCAWTPVHHPEAIESSKTGETSASENEPRLDLLLLHGNPGEIQRPTGFQIHTYIQILSEVNNAVVTVVFDCRWNITFDPLDTSCIRIEQNGRSMIIPASSVPRWLSTPKGYTVIAALASAVEIEFKDRSFGKLSYFVYQFLQDHGLRRKQKDLYAYLLTRYQESAANSSKDRKPVPVPMLFGDREQNFFGEEPTTSLVLHVAEAHGFCVGDELRLYSRNLGTLQRPITASIKQMNAVTSILDIPDTDPKESWVAVPRSRYRLRDFPVYLDQSIPNLDSLKKALSRHCLIAHEDGVQPYQFHIKPRGGALKDAGCFDILDSPGNRITYKPLAADIDAQSLATVILHLAQYTLVKSITNVHPSPRTEVKDFRTSFDIYIQTRSGSRYTPDQLIEFGEHNEKVSSFDLHLVNNSTTPLYVHILALGPLWQIELVNQVTLDSVSRQNGSHSHTLRQTMQTTVPPELSHFTYSWNTVKVFITTSPTTFTMFQQPVLDLEQKGPGLVGLTERLHSVATTLVCEEDLPIIEQWDAFNFPIRTKIKHHVAETSTLDVENSISPPLQDEYSSAASSHPYSSYRATSTMPSTVSDENIVAESASEIRSSITLFSYKKHLESRSAEQDDLDSLRSADEDIESRAETHSWAGNYLEAAVNFVVDVFARDIELLALYQQAMTGMNEAKFIRNHQRLLKTFFLDLHSNGGNTPSQDVAIRFFRSRNRRIRISSAMHHFLAPSNNTARERIKLMMDEGHRQDHHALSSYLDGLDSSPGRAYGSELDTQPSVPAVPDAPDAESETSTDYDESSGEDEDHAVSKLEATGEFLITGAPFRLFKQNFHGFLHPHWGAISGKESVPDNAQRDRMQSAKLVNIDYDVSLGRNFTSALQDTFKRRVESIAGCRLSWWPLSEPEDELKPGHLRVYSMPSTRCSRGFYDDIPISLAEQLFPKLRDAPNSDTGFSRSLVMQKTVVLHGTTLMRVLHQWRSGSQGSQQRTGDQYDIGSQTLQGSGRNLSGESSKSSLGQDTTEPPDKSVDDQQKDQPVIFMSADMKPNESIACTVGLGSNDKTTFQNLQVAHRKLPSWGWKRATGIKFYRVPVPQLPLFPACRWRS